MKTIPYQASGGESVRILSDDSGIDLVHLQAQESAYATEWASKLSGPDVTKQTIDLLGNVSLSSETQVYIPAEGYFDFGEMANPKSVVDLKSAGEFLEGTHATTAFLRLADSRQLLFWISALSGNRAGWSGERGTLDFDFFDKLLEATGSPEVVSMKDTVSERARTLLAGYEKQ